MSDELDLIREVKIARIFEALASGEANSITQACKIADVPRSTYYEWRKAGLFDELLAQMKAAIVAEVVSRVESAIPEVVDKLAKGAINEDGKLSARDSDQHARTLLLYYKDLAGGISPTATGEAATDWLKKQGSRFQPIQIVGSKVVIHSGEEPEIVEGEVEELEEG